MKITQFKITQRHSASEVTTLSRYTNTFIITIIMVGVPEVGDKN